MKKKTLTLVVTNSGDGDAPLSLDLSRFTQLGKTAAVVRTSPTEDWARPAPVALTGKTLQATLPAKSVTTFVIGDTAYTGPMNVPTSAAAFAPGTYTLINGDGRRLGGANGVWKLTDQEDGDYTLASSASGQVLDLFGSSHDVGAQVGEYGANGGDNQTWHLRKAKDGTYTLLSRESGLALSLGAAGLTQEADKGLPAETWRIVPK